MKTVVVVAPHPDDETLGCGGTILKHLAKGDKVHWLIITDMKASDSYSEDQCLKRDHEIKKVAASYVFSSVEQFAFAPASLSDQSKGQLVGQLSHYFQKYCPNTIYLPYKFDVHSDHQIVADAVVSAAKSFRLSCVQELLAYETLSETEYNVYPQQVFSPNYFVDISPYLSRKIEIMKTYAGEMSNFPFPRSEQAIIAQAHCRGAQAYVDAAEAFILLKKVC